MKYNYTRLKNDYKTPPDIINLARILIGNKEFELDTCCSDTEFPAKNHYINGITDGLTADWKRLNWCNPPFIECKKWIEKAYKEQQKGNTTVMIIPVRTETKYWHDYILFNDKAYIQWLRKGHRFLDGTTREQLNVFKNALALIVFKGKEDRKRG